jgi:transposase
MKGCEKMTATRYVGIDIHKRHVTVAAVSKQQHELLAPQKLSIQRFNDWAHKHLKPTDHVAIEATTNSWAIHDQLTSIVHQVAVANTNKLKMITSSASKTDRHDALVLAKLAAANLLPTIWVPPEDVRELRDITQHRTQLIQERGAAQNRLHDILHRHNLMLPDGNPFNRMNEEWWKDLTLSSMEQLQVRHYWETMHSINQQIAETEAVIAQLSASDRWLEPMTFLIQLTGVGLYTGMSILGAIGEIERFSSARKLVGYAGLGARVHATGDTYHTGKITKKGRRELRTALIASAWVAVRWSDHWRSVFSNLAKRIGKQKAITSIARRLLIVIWHVLTKREVDHHADPCAVARSIMTWCSYHQLARSNGMRRIEFVRQRLMVIGILDQVPSFRANGRTHYLITNP